eukprot:Tbor_TRINITY_DN5846_c0_g8::TRINITY_DN5846_c0_g8_i1::g.7193::m.7193
MFPMTFFTTETYRKQIKFYNQFYSTRFNTQKTLYNDPSSDESTAYENYVLKNGVDKVGLHPTVDDKKSGSDLSEKKKVTAPRNKRSQLCGYRIIAKKCEPTDNPTVENKSHPSAEMPSTKAASDITVIKQGSPTNESGTTSVLAANGPRLTATGESIGDEIIRETTESFPPRNEFVERKKSNDQGVTPNKANPPVVAPCPVFTTQLNSSATPFFGGTKHRQFTTTAPTTNTINNNIRAHDFYHNPLPFIPSNPTTPMGMGYVEQVHSFESPPLPSFQKPHHSLWDPNQYTAEPPVDNSTGTRPFVELNASGNTVTTFYPYSQSTEESFSHSSNMEDKPTDKSNAIVPVGDDLNVENEVKRLGGRRRSTLTEEKEWSRISSFIVIDPKRNTRINNPYCLPPKSRSTLTPLGVGLEFHHSPKMKQRLSDVVLVSTDEDTVPSCETAKEDTLSREDKRKEGEEETHRDCRPSEQPDASHPSSVPIQMSNFPCLSYYVKDSNGKKSADCVEAAESHQPQSTAVTKLCGWAAAVAAQAKQSLTNVPVKQNKCKTQSQKL